LAHKIVYRASGKFDKEDEGYHLVALTHALEVAEFSLKKISRFGLLGYAFSEFPDRLGLPMHVPGSIQLAIFHFY